MATSGRSLDGVALALEARGSCLLVGLLSGLLLLRGLLLSLLGGGRVLLAALASRSGRTHGGTGAGIPADDFAHHRAACRTAGAGPGVVPVAVVGGLAACGGGGGLAGSYFDCSTAQVWQAPSSFFCWSGDWPLAG